jgi:Dyp-type peroxidase family
MSSTLELTDIQGLVARGYGDLEAARFLLLSVREAAAARAFLRRLRPALTTSREHPRDSALNLALTATGLERLGVPAEVLAGFSEEFQSGMTTPHRSRLLGDFAQSAPSTWAWGGPGTPRVDVMLLVFAAEAGALDRRSAELAQQAESSGLEVVHRLDTSPLLEYEPFGFHDGISQPLMEGLPHAAGRGDAIRAGEFVLGYPNEYGRLTVRPLVASRFDPAALLPRDVEGSGLGDLGRNGSYLVARTLRQDVEAFWRYAEEATRQPDGSIDRERAVALAAKMVGRWPSGAPLVKAPHRDDPRLADDNDFGYHHTDRHGLACPMGAHVRRAHPRDSLDPDPGTEKSIAVGNRHRLLRRSRAYGRYGADRAYGGAGPEEEVGIHFLCLNGNLARQFEFVQHTWLANPNFVGLDNDADPLLGPRRPHGGDFTAQGAPVRRRYRDLPSFVTVRGGAYLFLPGLRALAWLAGEHA